MNATDIEPAGARELAKRLHTMYQVPGLQPDHPIARAVIELRNQAGVIEGLQGLSRAAGRGIRDAQLQISALTDHAELLRRQRDDLAMWLAQAVSWYASSGQHAPVGPCLVCDRVEQVTKLLERMRDQDRTSQNRVSSPAAPCGDFTRRGESSGGLSRWQG